jgi:hypothetical protein
VKQEWIAAGVQGNRESLTVFLGVIDAKQAILCDHPLFDLGRWDCSGLDEREHIERARWYEGRLDPPDR